MPTHPTSCPLRQVRFALLSSAFLSLAALLPTASQAAAPPAATVVPTMTAEQETDLSKGKVVIVEGLPPAQPENMRAMGVLDIDASADAVWRALYDWKGREADSANAKLVTPHDESSESGVRAVSVTWDIEVLGNKLQYTNRYTHWEPQSYLEFVLDDRKTNDLAFNWGSYRVVSTGPTTSRFFYTSETDTGRKLPGWVKEWLTKTGLKKMLKEIRTRATGYGA
ncbi:MAG: SRPBCC family protein [Deltaproteobacteria bacterium]|nr:SRPBCC family protein [Deltaproteobacteria bacterium]